MQSLSIRILSISLVLMPCLAQSQALEEIVVTAERREATVQDTAAAITAITGDNLRELGVVQPEELSATTPALHATVAGASGLQFYIRGVGNFSSNQFAEGAVSFNLNGIYLSRAWTYAGQFYDLERVEVLKGPQGTLYGRNSTGGAVNLITRRPEIGEDFSGYLNGEYGNYDNIRVDGAVNIPVNDQFALRGAFQVLDRDGYFSDGGSDAGSQSGRLSALFEPNEDISLLVVGDFQNIDDNGSGGTIAGPGPAVTGDYLDEADPWDIGVTSPQANALLATFGRGPLGVPATIQTASGQVQITDGTPFNKIENTGLMAQLDWDLGFATLTALPSYRYASLDSLNYAPGFLLRRDEEAEQVSFETRLASNPGAGPLEWVAGFYYFDESIDSNFLVLQQLIIPGTFPGENGNAQLSNLGTEAWALFGQGTYSLTDRLRLVAGVRYSEEDKTMAGSFTVNPPFDPLGPVPFTLPTLGEASFDDVTWKAGIEFDVTPDNMAYFNVGTGFKAGGFFIEQQQFGNTFEPEEITAYALGSKNRFLDGRLQLNVEAYYWDYQDHQESHLGVSPGGYAIFPTENIGQAEMKGVDIEGEFLLTEQDRFTFQFQYLDAEFEEFTYNAFGPVGPPFVGCPSSPNPAPPFFQVNCDGFPAVRAPEWAATLGYQHSFNLPRHGNVIFDVRSQISDGTYVSIDYLPASYQESFTRTDARLTYMPSGERWSVSAWVRNIEDEATRTGTFTSPFTTVNYAQLRAPRTYGVSAGFNF